MHFLGLLVEGERWLAGVIAEISPGLKASTGYLEYPSKSPCCATGYFDNRLSTYDKTLAGESVDDRQSWNFCTQIFT